MHIRVGDSGIEHPAGPFRPGTSSETVLQELQKAGQGTLKEKDPDGTSVTVTPETGPLQAGLYRFYPSNLSGKCFLQ